MVNEEDHLRLQVMRSGYALDEAWQEIDHATYARYHEELARVDDEFSEPTLTNFKPPR